MVSEPAAEKAQSSLNLERIVFFSDAVMAIAITLLIIDIRAPEAVAHSDLSGLLLAIWPKLLGFAVSFWVIALYWFAHLRCFGLIRGYNRRLVYLNFLFLMFVAFMPFPTSVLFSYPTQTASVVLYAGTAAGMGLSLAVLWIYACRHDFIVPGLPAAVLRNLRLNLLLPPVVFLFSAGLALFNTNLAMLVWFLLIPVYIIRRATESAIAEYTPT
jgi:uncharacterized membrane protein